MGGRAKTANTLFVFTDKSVLCNALSDMKFFELEQHKQVGSQPVGINTAARFLNRIRIPFSFSKMSNAFG